jgi:predicted GNAT family acetyltransferase
VSDPTIKILDAPAQGRYLLTLGGEAGGFLAYRRDGDRLIVDHTEVDERFEGRGLGGSLARHVLDDARARGLRVVPRCRFFAGYLERHPEDQDLVAQDDPPDDL